MSGKRSLLEKGIVINTPIYALMGTEEETCSEIENWKIFTDSDFRYNVLKGNHFFIYPHSDQIAMILNKSFSAKKRDLLTI